MKNSLFKNFLVFFLIFIAIASIFSLYNARGDQPEEINLGRMITLINENQVKAIEVAGDKLTLTLTDDSQKITSKEPAESFSTLLANYDIASEKIQNLNVSIK